MRALLLAGAAVLALTNGAVAWDTEPAAAAPTTINKGGQGGSGGLGGLGGTGGVGIGGAGGSGGAGGVGIGGAGGSAKASANAASRAAAGASAGVYIGSGAGSGSVAVNSPPGFALPSFGGGQCGIVGFGVAVSPSGGGAFGPAWESTNCRAALNAQMLFNMGYQQQAIALLRSEFPNVEAAFKVVPAAASEPALRSGAPAFCRTAGLQLSLYPECR